MGGEEQGRARQDAADGQGACRCGGAARCACAAQAPGTAGTPGTGTTGTGQGASPGTPPGALFGTALGTVPGLLLATGQMLPVTSVHRLARTSSLVRLVMDAEGQVLDMGRKVRLATPAQRRAIFARYATCWIDGCPLPASMCQIDHADNWSTGGLTDLKLLGPACQFHNRDRYQHPHRYTRRQTGTDRWTFTYHRLGATRLRV
nr:HNH endonuclease signature motif containing protein [Microbispora rosea]